ncbi:YbdK family carboxylate-amine ligase [Embleya sp. NBC_00896]|uniref:carboxylate-amine ligase n=1 Tax=Embleya sp. NBC_00896 TaxID=2975961 RepID=UPI003862E431|nr:YbdK family carboxylate-amine ligase [Embleya sp. NBC_00896]
MLKLSIQEEFHTVDLATKRMVSSAPALLERLPAGAFVGAAKESTVGIVTSPHADLTAARAELVDLRGTLVYRAAGLRLGVLAGGTAPMMSTADVRTAPDARYTTLDREWAEPARDWITCGTHVHVEVENRDVAARALAWITPHLSTLSAMSASSPFWAGRDTGYASWRRMCVERLPTAGPMGPLRSAREYDELIATLEAIGVAPDGDMFYPALRLSRQAPTLELRVCDAIADVETTIAIAALFRALCGYACRAVAADRTPPLPSPMIARGAMWRAARSGLEHDLIDPVAAVTLPAATVVRGLVAEMAPYLRECGDLDAVEGAVEPLLARGSGAARQRRAAREGGLASVVDQVLAETMACVVVSDTAPPPAHPLDIARG